jgi:hypothetical protein
MTGILTAKRGEDATFEGGTITFVKGQVIQAKVGRRNGPDALNWLSIWGMCRYMFISSDAPIPQNVFLPTTTDNSMATLSPFPLQLARERQTGPLTQIRASFQRQEPSISPTPASTDTLPPSISQIVVPYRTRQLDDALRILEYKGLSRTHKHLFLLIDGQRTIPELVRVLKRNENEVMILLQDLERASTIKLPI